jgi:REP element-mobilizing transposase RayT
MDICGYFFDLLGFVVTRFHWICHGYRLMDNRYHRIIETPEGNLSKGMRQLNGIYTQKYNWRYKKTGHVFQGRYKAIIVDKDSYLLELCRYVVLNPIRAGYSRKSTGYGSGATTYQPQVRKVLRNASPLTGY